MKVKSIIICEDIRKEVGNKISVMGLLGSELNVDMQSTPPSEAPVTVPLAALISIEHVNKKNDSQDFHVIISIYIGEHKIAKMTARLEPTGTGKISHIPVPRFEIGVTDTTKVSIHVQVMEKDTLLSEDTAIIDINLNRNSK